MNARGCTQLVLFFRQYNKAVGVYFWVYHEKIQTVFFFLKIKEMSGTLCS